VAVGGFNEDAVLVLDEQGLDLAKEGAMKRIVEMKEVGKEIQKILEHVKSKPIWITSDGVDIAVLISPELFEALVEAEEELEDIAAVDEAMKEKSIGTPWEKVKKNLGLDD
jgi:PHD/YefM family antitoxin component YafN of YafNO toxin-antitoxin module